MSKISCRLHRGIVTLLLIMIAAAGAGSVGLLAYSRAQTGSYAGPGSITSQMLAQSAARMSVAISAHASLVLTIAAMTALVTLGLAWLELRTLAQRAPRLVLSRGALGEVAINLDQIGLIAQREAEHVVGVREVETSAQPTKGGIDVKQRVAIEPEMAFTELAEQVQQRVKKSLEYHLGFPVASVQVLLQHASLRKSVI